MEERQATIDGETHSLPRPFLVVATQNPVELEGTFPLPEAQLDRFLLRIKLGYPDEAEENEMVLRFEAVNPLETLRPVIEVEELLQLQCSVHKIHVDPSVRNYAVQIARATRQHRSVQLGASPRATLALYRAAQARALLDGRGFVIPDDVKALASAVLGHRLILDAQARVRGHGPDSVVQEVLQGISVPV